MSAGMMSILSIFMGRSSFLRDESSHPFYHVGRGGVFFPDRAGELVRARQPHRDVKLLGLGDELRIVDACAERRLQRLEPVGRQAGRARVGAAESVAREQELQILA